MRASGAVRAVLTAALAAAPAAALVPPEAALVDRLRGAGLQRVEEVEGTPRLVRGRLPGEGGLEVLLFAGCGPGARRSRDAALLAAADLARTPRRHTLEVLVCAAGAAGPGLAATAAAGWLARRPEERDEVLVALHLEWGDRPGGRAVGLSLAGSGPDRRRLPPAWLAHAALAGGGAAGGALTMGDRRWPIMGQLLGRHARSRRSTGAEPFLAAGVPALTLTGGGDGWPAILAGIVRRLDALPGRPRDDDEYLAAAGRVWSRRDLYWAGLAVFVGLVAGARPGAWRGAGGGARRRRGRRYLPGFLLRMAFLASLLLAPASTLVLLAPAALLGLAPLRRPLAVWLVRALALLPVALFAGYCSAALFAGRVAAWPAEPARLALLLGAVGLAVALIGRSPRSV